jgi:hypothetical protein
MNNNQIIIKTDPRGKAIVSLILGIVSLGYYPFLGILEEKLHFGEFSFFGIFLGGIVFGLISISGLILGFQGRKSTKRKLAIAGIILSTIGLLAIIIIIISFFTYIFLRYFWGG